MFKFLKNAGWTLLGIAVLILVTAIPVLFIEGGVVVAVKILPWLSMVMAVVFVLDVLIILPLGIFRKTKALSGIGLVISSYVYGLTLWLWTLLLTYVIWGGIAVIAGLLIVGVGVVPMAMLATAFKGEWSLTGQIVLLLVLTFGSRIFGLYLGQRAEELS